MSGPVAGEVRRGAGSGLTGARTATRGDVVATSFAPAVWGSTYYVTTEFLPEDRPLLAGTVRALPAGIALVLLTRTVLRGEWWWKATVLGALNIGFFFFFLFLAAYHLPGGVAALVMSVQPLFVLGFGVGLLRERIRPTHVLACLMAILGVGLLVVRSQVTLTPVGVLAGLAGAVSMAAGIVLTKRWGRPAGVGLLGFTGAQLLLGGALLLPATLLVEGLPTHVTGTNVAGFAYLAVVGALLAYTLWFRGIEQLPALTISFLGFLSPIMATLLGLLLLGQTLTIGQLAGAVLLIVSVVVIVRRTPPVDRSPAPEPANTDRHSLT